MVLAPAFGWAVAGMESVPDRLWTLLTVGIGGYVAGRSGEKIAKSLATAKTNVLDFSRGRGGRKKRRRRRLEDEAA